MLIPLSSRVPYEDRSLKQLMSSDPSLWLSCLLIALHTEYMSGNVDTHALIRQRTIGEVVL